jgi:hypothetical protein
MAIVTPTLDSAAILRYPYRMDVADNKLIYGAYAFNAVVASLCALCGLEGYGIAEIPLICIGASLAVAILIPIIPFEVAAWVIVVSVFKFLGKFFPSGEKPIIWQTTTLSIAEKRAKVREYLRREAATSVS